LAAIFAVLGHVLSTFASIRLAKQCWKLCATRSRSFGAAVVETELIALHLIQAGSFRLLSSRPTRFPRGWSGHKTAFYLTDSQNYGLVATCGLQIEPPPSPSSSLNDEEGEGDLGKIWVRPSFACLPHSYVLGLEVAPAASSA